MSRPISTRATLLRLGFTDTEHTLSRLPELGAAADPLLAVFGRTADPDLALDALAELADVVSDRSELLEVLAADEGTAMRLLSVLGASEALGQFLLRHPEEWYVLTDATLGSTRPPGFHLREELLRAVGADPDEDVPVTGLSDRDAMDALRVAYHRQLLRLAARDLAHDLGVDDAGAELSDLAGAALEAGLAVARARVSDHTDARLAVIAMGKTGGHELNYVSDVDVVFVHEPAEGAEDERARRVATSLASHLIRVCSDHTAEGTLWTVDAALRPEGKSGPLTRTLASHVSYYERWASTWEFQALLKARPIAGDRALGRGYVAELSPLVWTAAERDGFVPDTQAMRRRVVENIPAKDADRELKLGEGGLRDVEFAVQLLQLVHGRVDDRLRVPTTLSALHELTEGGYVGRVDGEALHVAYAFLRRMEHRLQLFRLRRTHVVPRDEDGLRRLGRSMGFLRSPIDGLQDAWAHQRREVRRLHEKLFYRPLLSAVAQVSTAEGRLTTEAAVSRLTALGYADPKAALRHLQTLTSGVSRRAQIQRALLPAMLQWFAEGPDPDAGLFGFRRISDALGQTPWYLRALRDGGPTAERLARLLSTSRYTTSLLEREPEGVRMLAESLTPIPAAALIAEMRSTATRRAGAEAAVKAIRTIRRRELFRISAAELLGLVDIVEVCRALTGLTHATLEVTLEAVIAELVAARGVAEPPTRIAVVAMGRYGGFEMSYASDADVMFVHRPASGVDAQEAASFAQAAVGELRRLLAAPGADPALTVDADLRPEGRHGALVRTLDSFAAYYAKWSQVWEAQALLRADAVVGDAELRADFTALIDPLRYPAEGLSEDDALEIRRIKGRVDAERLPRGADPKTHLKLGPGGLADIEWTVQLLQLRHAHEVPGLRTARTLEALAAAREAGLITPADADQLREAWRQVSRVRNAVTLARGRGLDSLPTAWPERRAVAAILGYPQGETETMVNDHLRITRLARGVIERVFWEQ